MQRSNKFAYLMRQTRAAALAGATGLVALMPTTALGWDYSFVPLFWEQGIKPNVVLALDNSGSMQALSSSESFARAKQNGSLNSSPLSNDWYWCTNYDNTSKSCTSGNTAIDSGFSVFAWTPPKLFSCSWNESCSYKATLPRYIGDTSSRSRTVSLCNVDKKPGDANFYIGQSGSSISLNSSTWPADYPTANNIGVLVTNKRGGGGTMDSCVRWKMASTGSKTSDRDYNPWDNNYIGTLYHMDGGLEEYGRFLLNALVSGKGSYNFNDDTVYPVQDTADTQRSWDDEQDKLVSQGGKPSNNKYFIIPNTTRMQAAREASQKVVTDFISKMNIGLYTLNGDRQRAAVNDGSNSDAAKRNLIGTTDSMLLADLPGSALDGKVGELNPSTGGTPLASTQRDINTYYKGSTSPIQYRCQKNYTVMMTDGEPSRGEEALDTRMEEAYADMRTANSHGVDADGKSWDDTTKEEWKIQNVVSYTIGLGLENNLLKRAPLVNRVDVTKSDITDNEIKLVNHGLSTGDYVQIVSGAPNNFTNGNYYYAVRVDKDKFKLASSSRAGDSGTSTTNNKQKAFDCEATGTTTNSGPCLPITGGNGTMVMSTGPGKAFFSFTPEQLARDLGEVFNRINILTASASAVSTNTKQFSGEENALVYQARFNTEDWSGEVVAFPIEIDGTGKATVDTSKEAIPAWTTKSTLTKPGDRPKLFTWNPTLNSNYGQAVDFAWDNLSPAQKTALGGDVAGPKVVSWLKGNEVAGLRPHSINGLLGDIINSDPVYLSYLNMSYASLPASDSANCTVASDYSSASGSGCTGAEIYRKYVESQKTRTPMIYVGANDGMLHGFDANTGKEKLAYIPAAVYTDVDNSGAAEKKLLNLTDLNYVRKHRYFVDGSLITSDVFLNGKWQTYLVGGLGRGGRGVFAIDVTDTTFDTSDIKWEFSHNELGYSYGQPIIARLANNNWYAIFPNGLDSASNQAGVFVVNLADKNDFKFFKTNVGSAAQQNGMMSVQVRVDESRTVTDIYAGDMRGNLWKFDVYDNDNGTVIWPTVGTRLFTAGDNTTGTPQAITGGIRVGKVPNGLGSLIFFGTGKYFETKDAVYKGDSVPQIDTFYAVLDNGTSVNLTRANLQQQTFSMDPETKIRTSSQIKTDYTPGGNRMGWFIDLLNGTQKVGERMVSSPVLYGGRIIFVTIVPQSGGTCGGEGTSWLNELDALTGGMLDEKVLDTNGDGRIDDADEQLSSLQIEGMGSTPPIGEGSDRHYKVIGTTSKENSIKIVSETPPGALTGLPGGKGRMSWKQLQ